MFRLQHFATICCLVYLTWPIKLVAFPLVSILSLKVELFIWMQNKFQPVNLMELKAALARKESASAMIKLGLEEAEKLKLDHCYVKRDSKIRERWAQNQAKAEEHSGFEDSEGEESETEGIGSFDKVSTTRKVLRR
jgi:hypothetical protein